MAKRVTAAAGGTQGVSGSVESSPPAAAPTQASEATGGNPAGPEAGSSLGGGEVGGGAGSATEPEPPASPAFVKPELKPPAEGDALVKYRAERAQNVALQVLARFKDKGRSAAVDLVNLQQYTDELLLQLEGAAVEPGFDRVSKAAAHAMVLKAAGLAESQAGAIDDITLGLGVAAVRGAVSLLTGIPVAVLAPAK